MRTIIALLALAAAPLAFAGADCPEVAKEKWMSAKEVQAAFESRGWRVDRVKKEGSCLEVLGRNRDGKRAEAYVNPADGSVVKARVKS